MKKIEDIIVNIQSIFERGFIQKEFVFHDDSFDFMFVRFYFPKIFFGSYTEEFDEKYFKVGIEAKTSLSLYNSIENENYCVDHIHIGFNCIVLGFGFGIFRQRGY